jgi:hypothetical protein
MLMRRIGAFSLIAFVILIVGLNEATATTAIAPSDQEMVVSARAIVRGNVVGMSAGLDRERGIVMTYVRLMVNDVLTGEISTDEIVVRVPGGEMPGLGTLIHGTPKFVIGQDVLLYLDTWGDGSLRVHQGFLGKYNISRDAATGRSFVERDEDESVTYLAHSGTPGTRISEYEIYVRTIRNMVASNAEGRRSFEQRYFAGISILAAPPEFDRSMEDEQFIPLWSLQNPTTAIRWFQPDSGEAVVFHVNPTGAPGSNIVADVEAALYAWSTATGTSMRLSMAGVTGGCGVQGADGQNTVSFTNCDGFFSPSSGCTGILAVSGIIRYFPTITKIINGQVFAKADEANVAFNPYLLCNFSNRCQIQEVMTHELGHSLGLGHSSEPAATMASVAHYDNRCASLLADDVAGIAYIYPGPTGRSRLRISTSADLSSANIGDSYAERLSASGGSGAYVWSLIAGDPAPGMIFSPSGLLYGDPTSQGSFTFTAQVRDSEGRTAERSFSLLVQPPTPLPEVLSANYKKKKVTIAGNNLSATTTVFLDDRKIGSKFNGSSLVTKKRVLEPGQHSLYVVNGDGKQSARFNFDVP